MFINSVRLCCLTQANLSPIKPGRFSDKKDYFLDFITYHGTDEEFLELVEKKNTQVLIDTDALAYNEDTFVISFNEQQCNSFFGDKP